MNIIQKSVALADPHICSDAKNRLTILNAIFDCLVQRDNSGNFLPSLAARWYVEPDARQWQFQLREDVRFHNGDLMTANDVVASLKRACDPSVGGELGTEGVWASYLGDAEIAAVDPQTVSLVTNQPMADLLDLLVAIPIMPVRVLSDVPNVFAGTGAWRLVEHSEEQVILERFDGNQINRSGSVDGERIVLRGEPEEETRIGEYLTRRVDLAADISAKGRTEIAKAGGMLIGQPANLCVAFLCNASQGVCNSRAFRRALNYAVNAERMVERAYAGQPDSASLLNGPLTHFHFGCDVQVASYPYDPEQARALLDEAGVPTSMVIDVPMTLPDEAPLLGELLAEDLAAVGIDVTLRHFEDRTAYAHMVKDKQIDDACCFDSSPLSTYRVLREKLNSDVAGPWWQGYHNPQVNQLLETASRTVNQDERHTVYHQAYRLIHDDAPWIFLYHPTNYWGVGDGMAITASSEGWLRL